MEIKDISMEMNRFVPTHYLFYTITGCERRVLRLPGPHHRAGLHSGAGLVLRASGPGLLPHPPADYSR